MKYDLVMVFTPESKEKTVLDKIKQLLEKSGFEVTEESWWGKKKLAYPIKKHTEANYASMVISSTTAKPQHLSKIFKLEENILRYLVLKKKERNGN